MKSCSAASWVDENYVCAIAYTTSLRLNSVAIATHVIGRATVGQVCKIKIR